MPGKTKEYWIEKLGLQPHPKEEKGFFRETHRDEYTVTGRTGEERAASTVIYFLHDHDVLSENTTFFKVKHTEMIHHYHGSPLTLYYIDEKERKLNVLKLGEEEFHFPFPKDTWFTRVCEVEGGYSLIGCTVSPGFDFKDLVTTPFKELKNLFDS